MPDKQRAGIFHDLFGIILIIEKRDLLSDLPFARIGTRKGCDFIELSLRVIFHNGIILIAIRTVSFLHDQINDSPGCPSFESPSFFFIK